MLVTIVLLQPGNCHPPQLTSRSSNLQLCFLLLHWLLTFKSLTYWSTYGRYESESTLDHAWVTGGMKPLLQTTQPQNGKGQHKPEYSDPTTVFVVLVKYSPFLGPRKYFCSQLSKMQQHWIKPWRARWEAGMKYRHENEASLFTDFSLLLHATRFSLVLSNSLGSSRFVSFSSRVS